MGKRMEGRRRRTPEFKVEAVRLMRERLATGLTLQRVSEELEIRPDMLRVWAKHVDAAPADASPQQIFPGSGQKLVFSRERAPLVPARTATTEEDNARLRRENERLRQERDFLKKATAFFAKESR